MEFKIGDKVRLINNQNVSSFSVGIIGVIESEERYENYRAYYSVNFGYNANQLIWANCLELIDKINLMNLKEKFVLAITPEPKKSYRKVGITDGDDVPTDEGVRIIIGYLLHNPDKTIKDFKTDVVDPILKEKEEEKK